MSSSTGPNPITAPDSYGAKPGDPGYFACPDAAVVTIKVYNASIVWRRGLGNPPYFEDQPEVNEAPVTRSMAQRADAIQFRAAVPAAQLPAGQPQATVAIDAR